MYSSTRETVTHSMSKSFNKSLSLFAVWLGVLLSGSAEARDIHQDEALRLRESGQILPLEQLLSSTVERYPGARLLEVELEEKKHGTLIYEIELLTTQGVVRELKINARDGRILKDEED